MIPHKRLPFRGLGEKGRQRMNHPRVTIGTDYEGDIHISSFPNEVADDLWAHGKRGIGYEKELTYMLVPVAPEGEKQIIIQTVNGEWPATARGEIADFVVTATLASEEGDDYPPTSVLLDALAEQP